MTGTMSDIDWEIKQLEVAIVYYENGIQNATTIAEIEKCRKTILNLMDQIKALRRRKDEL